MLLWIEGFEGFGTSNGAAPSPANVMARKYTVASESDFLIVTGRYVGMALKLNAAGAYLQPANLTVDQTMTVGLAYKTPLSADLDFLTLYDGATRGINLRSTTAGELAIYRDNTQLAISSGLGLVANAWNYIELKVKCAADGTYEVHVNGTQIAALTSASANTRAGGHDFHTTFRLKAISGESPIFDDVYCLDSTGARNTSFLGAKQVITLFPNGAGTSQWIPSAGSNYACVDENPSTDNADYVSGQSGNLDLYNYSDVDTGVAGIVGVQINTELRHSGVAHNVSQQAKLSSTETGNASQAAPASYATLSRLMEQDPTGTDWTAANINSTQFGVKVL